MSCRIVRPSTCCWDKPRHLIHHHWPRVRYHRILSGSGYHHEGTSPNLLPNEFVSTSIFFSQAVYSVLSYLNLGEKCGGQSCNYQCNYQCCSARSYMEPTACQDQHNRRYHQSPHFYRQPALWQTHGSRSLQLAPSDAAQNLKSNQQVLRVSAWHQGRSRGTDLGKRDH